VFIVFSTVLDKVTGYFDRRTVISAFLPSLIFWMLVVVMFVTLQMDWSSVIGMWDRLSITLQLLLFLAFLAWTTFWSFLTINFRVANSQMYEGYWPSEKPFNLLLNWRRAYWSKCWNSLNGRDRELASQEAILVNEKNDYERLRASLNSEQTSVRQTMDEAQVEQELDRFLVDLKKKLDPLTSIQQISVPRGSIFTQLRKKLDPATLHKLGKEARERWEQSGPWREEARGKKNSSWIELHKRLEELTAQLEDLVDERLEEVRVLRQPLYRDLSLYYPSRLANIMPTQLGNVMKATELYSWERYQLDAVLIWPRLQSSLPDAFSTSLQDAKTSLDVMMTLSTFILLFGLPLALWTTIKATAFLPWWVPFIIALVALPFRRYIQCGLAVLAVLLSLTLPHPSLLVIWLQTLTIISVGVVFLSWFCYRSAVQAALDYGEKLKAAFDLYRWKILEDLHLRLPENFEEERHIWREIGGLLAHNDPPKSSYYRYVQLEHNNETSSDVKKKGN